MTFFFPLCALAFNGSSFVDKFLCLLKALECFKKSKKSSKRNGAMSSGYKRLYTSARMKRNGQFSSFSLSFFMAWRGIQKTLSFDGVLKVAAMNAFMLDFFIEITRSF
jgi:hypothetical protein